MALTEQKEEKDQSKKEEIRYRITPTRYFDYSCTTNEWELEIHLPGVDKKNIHFKILKEGAYEVQARRDSALYRRNEYFPFEVDTKSIKAEYENGLLMVKGKIKDPLAEAHEIKLQ